MRGKPKRRGGSSQKATKARPAARKPAAKTVAAKGVGAKDKRKVPPFGRRSHRVTHATARRMREKFLRRYPGSRAPLAPGAYDRGIFEKILKQKRCKGIRFYPGLDEDGQVTLLFAGVDGEGNDILAGIIGDMPFRCPPYCASSNDVLQF
jgi:hypothetical protein